MMASVILLLKTGTSARCHEEISCLWYVPKSCNASLVKLTFLRCLKMSSMAKCCFLDCDDFIIRRCEIHQRPFWAIQPMELHDLLHYSVRQGISNRRWNNGMAV